MVDYIPDLHPRSMMYQWWCERIQNLFRNVVEIDRDAAELIMPKMAKVINGLNDGTTTEHELYAFAGQLRKVLEGEAVRF